MALGVPIRFPLVPITHISDTARWVAVYRAMESARPDALFRDPFAERLAGSHGRAIVDAMPHGRRMAWAMIVRTAVLDEIILDVIRDGAADLVLNLAAGLDARPWRLDLPPALRWVDVDLPRILEYKAEIIGAEPPRCRYEAVPADLRDASRRQALFAQVGREASRVLVVSEGLLVYLEPQQVAALARDLHEPPAVRWWTFDLASPRLLQMVQRSWKTALDAGNAPFRFAPGEGPGFFAPFGWRAAQVRYAADEARRLKRQMAFGWLWRAVMRFYPKRTREAMRQLSAFVLLERT